MPESKHEPAHVTLRRVRKARGLTQTDAASELGTTKNTVSRWERGELGMSGRAVALVRLWAAQEPA